MLACCSSITSLEHKTHTTTLVDGRPIEHKTEFGCNYYLTGQMTYKKERKVGAHISVDSVFFGGGGGITEHELLQLTDKGVTILRLLKLACVKYSKNPEDHNLRLKIKKLEDALEASIKKSLSSNIIPKYPKLTKTMELMTKEIKQLNLIFKRNIALTQISFNLAESLVMLFKSMTMRNKSYAFTFPPRIYLN